MAIFKKLFPIFITVACGCASTPEVTLKPSDVPSLYGDFSPVGTPVSELREIPASAGGESIEHGIAALAGGVEADMPGGAQRDASSAQCTAIVAELEKLDGGLGGPAEDSAPAPAPTAMQKTGKAFYDLGVETLKGYFQLFIQSKRAVMGDAEKERLLEEAIERGTTRRAYLLGYAAAAGCNLDRQEVALGEAQSSSEAPGG